MDDARSGWLALGLAGVNLVNPASPEQLDRLGGHGGLAKSIEAYWSDEAHRRNRSWSEHRDINEVMLATALIPEGYCLLD